MNSPRLSKIYRFPLKGFSGQSLSFAHCLADQGITFDRAFAVSNAQRAIAAGGNWTACQAFVRLTKNPSISRFVARFDEDRLTLRLTHPSAETLIVALNDPASIELANAKLRQWFPAERAVVGAPQLVSARAGYWDHDDATISIINAASVEQLAYASGHAIDSLRFRGNLLVAGARPWEELQWLGCEIKVGDVTLEILRPIDRCSATSIDPETGECNLNVPALLARHVGHAYCGVYARVARGGRLRVGDAVSAPAKRKGLFIAAARPATAPAISNWPRVGNVTEVIEESVSVRSLWLRDPLSNDGVAAPYQAGQHIRLHGLGERGIAWRSYTLSGIRADGSLRVTIKREPNAGCSQWIHQKVTLGSSVFFSGPFGDFVLPASLPSHITLLSAGIGITPILAMLSNISRINPKQPVMCFHVSRTRHTLVLWPEMLSLAAEMPNVALQLFLSQEDAENSDMDYAFNAGRPDLSKIAKAVVDQTAQAFVCGPDAFTQEAIACLQHAGVSNDDIHFERFASPTIASAAPMPPPHPGPFKVRFAHSNIEAEWREEAGSLLDLAERQGLAPAANCRSGACGACKQRLVRGTVAHTTQPIMPLGEHALLLCCAVPTSNLEISV
jgi:ferredoxin-NADP reductase/uncharacterized protein YcbX